MQRVDRVRERLAVHKLDALIVSSSVNLRYLFGFTGSNAIALITDGLSFFITDRRYGEQSHKEVSCGEIIIAKKELLAELQAVPAMKAGLRIGIEAASLTVKEFSLLKKTFPGMKFLASERIVEGVASVKEAEEIAAIRKAAKICGSVFMEIQPLIRRGVSELDISAEISYRTRRYGSEKDPFEPIVASGERSALPHGISSSKKIQTGESVVIDFGAVFNGYAADTTRTFILGEPTEKQSNMAKAVLAALEKSEKAAKPGLIGWQLDAVARKSLEHDGLGKYFMHSLGHGLGLNVHEIPRLGENSQDKLVPGNVMTLEPGVYIPGYGGVRVEDDFLVTETGVENLSPFQREVLCVG